MTCDLVDDSSSIDECVQTLYHPTDDIFADSVGAVGDPSEMQDVFRMTLELETLVVSRGLFTDLLSKTEIGDVIRKMGDSEVRVMTVDCDTHVFRGGAEEFEKKQLEFFFGFVFA